LTSRLVDGDDLPRGWHVVPHDRKDDARRQDRVAVVKLLLVEAGLHISPPNGRRLRLMVPHLVPITTVIDPTTFIAEAHFVLAWQRTSAASAMFLWYSC